MHIMYFVLYDLFKSLRRFVGQGRLVVSIQCDAYFMLFNCYLMSKYYGVH
jgi:hypothetical protein